MKIKRTCWTKDYKEYLWWIVKGLPNNILDVFYFIDFDKEDYDSVFFGYWYCNVRDSDKRGK